jgi:transcriptional regulator with XRE-family HTH domain
MKLKEIRNSKNLTFAKLSELSNVPLRTIQDIERNGDCRYSTLVKLADALGVSLDDFRDNKNPLTN